MSLSLFSTLQLIKYMHILLTLGYICIHTYTQTDIWIPFSLFDSKTFVLKTSIQKVTFKSYRRSPSPTPCLWLRYAFLTTVYLNWPDYFMRTKMINTTKILYEQFSSVCLFYPRDSVFDMLLQYYWYCFFTYKENCFKVDILAGLGKEVCVINCPPKWKFWCIP